MPLADRYVEGYDWTTRTKFDGLCTNPIYFIIKLLYQSSAQTHDCFR